MLTIEQAALEYAEPKANDLSHCNMENLNMCDFEKYLSDAFKAGAEFAQQMISFDKEKPEYYTPVIIEYESNEYIAWLAWSEEWGYVWTINGTDVWLEHKPNIKWRTTLVK